jgi:hypothetical protein
MSTKSRWAAGALGAITLGEVALIHLGRTYGSTPRERSEMLPGDRIVSDPKEVTDHAITIVHPRRPTTHRVRSDRRRDRTRPSTRDALEQPPAHELAAARNTRLVVGLRTDTARPRSPDALPLPLAMDDRPLVADPRRLGWDRSRRLHHVQRHAPRSQAASRACPARAAARVMIQAAVVAHLAQRPGPGNQPFRWG